MPGILENRASGLSSKPSEEGKEKAKVSGKSIQHDISRDSLEPETEHPQKRKNNKRKENKAADEFMKNRSQNFDEEAVKNVMETRLTAEEIKELEAIEASMNFENDLKEKKRAGVIKKINMAVLFAACIYLTILIYGTVVTQFDYNEKGQLAPIEMSVEDIENKNDFLTVVGLYFQCRSLYDNVLNLDYRVAKNVEDVMAIAPEYESAIEIVDAIGVRINATRTNAKYNQLLSMMYTWVNSDMFNYCHWISIAITQDDTNAQQEAITVRELVSNDFKQITKNVITLASEIKGYDTSDLTEWSPESVALRNEGIEN